MLETIFKSLVKEYSNDDELVNSFWEEIEAQYSTAGRFYHTLKHLENLVLELFEVKEQVQDWYTILFTLFYHDLIYHVLQNNNEESSAELAATRLTEINYPAKRIEICKQQILATKLHVQTENTDTNLFLDADLSILGKPMPIYSKYMDGIRNEFKIYPKVYYNKGREQVLRHFLKMPRIYKTDHFYNLYEKQAKINIAMELKFISR